MILPARHKACCLLLPPLLLPPVGFYAVMARFDRVVVDTALRYDKRRKATHRYDIADVRGQLTLTVPVVKPDGCGGTPTWADARVSRHGAWWHVHRETLESAYGRTPFCEFLIDKFDGVIADPGTEPPTVIELNRRADEVVRSILGMEQTVEWRPATEADAVGAIDLRHSDFATPAMAPYWQVRRDMLGFIPSLSIIDLIFNIGPEAVLYLNNLHNFNQK